MCIYNVCSRGLSGHHITTALLAASVQSMSNYFSTLDCTTLLILLLDSVTINSIVK